MCENPQRKTLWTKFDRAILVSTRSCFSWSADKYSLLLFRELLRVQREKERQGITMKLKVIFSKLNFCRMAFIWWAAHRFVLLGSNKSGNQNQLFWWKLIEACLLLCQAWNSETSGVEVNWNSAQDKLCFPSVEVHHGAATVTNWLVEGWLTPTPTSRPAPLVSYTHINRSLWVGTKSLVHTHLKTAL